MAKLVLLILAVVCSRCSAVPKTVTLLGEVFTTVEKALDFFSEDYSSINVDGLFGLRLGQGQLKEAIRECEQRSCDVIIKTRLQDLDHRLSVACDSALPYVEQSDPAYYERFIATINSPYILPYTPTEFTDVPSEIGSQSNYNEEKGDACYARILGTYKENGSTLPRCNVTDDCWAYMKQGDTRAYFITHQLLYFILIEKVGCRQAVEDYINGDKLFDIQKDLCSKIYADAKHLENNGKVQFYRKDLFLEQTVLCGPLGFEDFLRPDWMTMVLTWPDKKLGCFRSELVKQVLALESEALTSLEKMNGQKHTMRKLLREKEMKDGCLSHTSGLGFGVLSTYLRYLVKNVR